MKKYLKYIPIFIFASIFFGGVAMAQSIPSQSPWFYDAFGNITQIKSGNPIKITGLSDGCLGLSSSIITSSDSPCGSGGGSSFGYPFPLTGNATSTLTQFNGGLTAFASSTIGDGTTGLTSNGALTIVGTGFTYDGVTYNGTTGTNNLVGSAAPTFSGAITIPTPRGGTTATSLINLQGTTNANPTTAGVTFSCKGQGGVNGISNICATFLNNTGYVGIGSSTPWANLSIQANPLNYQVVGNEPLFAVASSTGSATTTLDEITNTGQLQVPVGGLLASPMYSFVGDTNTGFRDASADDLRIGVNGVDVFRSAGNVDSVVNLGISSNLNITPPTNGLYVQGLTGLGTTSPYANLSVMGGGTFTAQPASTLFAIGSSTAGTATSTLFTVTSGGNVGIDTSSPALPLEIDGVDSGSTALFGINATANNNLSLATQSITLNRTNSSNSGLTIRTVNSGAWGATGGFINLSPSNVVALTALTNGNIGIGSSTPGSILSIGTTNGINFSTATSTFNSTGGINIASGCFAIANTCLGSSGGISSISIASANGFAGSSSGGSTPALTISTSQSGILEGNGTSLTGVSGTAGWFPYFNATNTVLATSTVFVSTARKVGISTTTPNASLDVKGAAYSECQTVADGSTVTLDWSTGNCFAVTIAASRTLAFTNVIAGQTIRVFVTQGPTGSFTLTYPSTVNWPSATAPTLSTATGNWDVLSFTTATSSATITGAGSIGY